MFQEMNSVKTRHSILFLMSTLILILSSCASNKIEKQILKNTLNPTYYIWHTGVSPAGTGMNCKISIFSKDIELKADSLIVNDMLFETETIQKGDSTLIIGNYYIGPDFDNPNASIPDYFLSEKFSGTVKIMSGQSKFWLNIDKFTKTQNKHQHL